MMENIDTLSKYSEFYNKKEYLDLNEEMSFSEYLDLCRKKPKLARNAFQYIYDMIMAKGTSTFERYRRTYTKYHFFDNPETPVFGLEETLSSIVDFIHGAAGGYGTERRILLLHGPVGSSKSTICRRLKRGLEEYSRTKDGAWYTYKWIDLPIAADDLGPAIFVSKEDMSAMNENPIKLMPFEMRKEFLKELNIIHEEQSQDDDVYRLACEGDINPRCKLFMNMLLKRYKGDWLKVVKNHIRVVRRVHSEVDRVGIGTFQPKDSKNQDISELLGSQNLSLIGTFGSDSDPRAFDFNGEFEVATMGMLEFIEILKLDIAFLYELLGATQEKNIKPKNMTQVSIDEFIVGHTNSAEYERLLGDSYMEALKDRTIKVEVPYLTRLSDELKIYESNYSSDKIKHHIMPHSLYIVSFFAILTRLNEEDDSSLDIRDKVKLYDGKQIPKYTEDTVAEIRLKHPEEGMDLGLSARFIQDAISNCLARQKNYINVFHILSEIKHALRHSSLINDVKDIARYEKCVELALKEFDVIAKNEVRSALHSDSDAINRLCNRYIDAVVCSVNGEKQIHPVTKQLVDPDETLMRSIEEKAGIPEQGAPDFRRSIAAFIGSLSRRNQEFKWDTNPELKQALELHLFETVKDTVKISTLTKESADIDPKLSEQIEAIKTRLIKQKGYTDESASDLLTYVSSLYSASSDD